MSEFNILDLDVIQHSAINSHANLLMTACTIHIFRSRKSVSLFIEVMISRHPFVGFKLLIKKGFMQICSEHGICYKVDPYDQSRACFISMNLLFPSYNYFQLTNFMWKVGCLNPGRNQNHNMDAQCHSSMAHRKTFTAQRPYSPSIDLHRQWWRLNSGNILERDKKQQINNFYLYRLLNQLVLNLKV